MAVPLNTVNALSGMHEPDSVGEVGTVGESIRAGTHVCYGTFKQTISSAQPLAIGKITRISIRIEHSLVRTDEDLKANHPQI